MIVISKIKLLKLKKEKEKSIRLFRDLYSKNDRHMFVELLPIEYKLLKKDKILKKDLDKKQMLLYGISIIIR